MKAGPHRAQRKPHPVLQEAMHDQVLLKALAKLMKMGDGSSVEIDKESLLVRQAVGGLPYGESGNLEAQWRHTDANPQDGGSCKFSGDGANVQLEQGHVCCDHAPQACVLLQPPCCYPFHVATPSMLLPLLSCYPLHVAIPGSC